MRTLTPRETMTLTPSTRRFRLLLGAFVLCALASTAHAREAPLEPFRGNYDVLRNDVVQGTATISLQRTEDGNWDFSTLTTGTRGVFGLAGVAISEQSILRWNGDGPELVSYEYDQRAAWKSKRRSLYRHGGFILSRYDGHEAALAWEPGVLDRHAVVLAIAADLAAGTGTLSYLVADKDKLALQNYRNAGRERTASPAGAYDTVRIERVRENSGRTTTSWLAPGLGYMPVRVVQREPGGDSMELRLRSLPRR